MKYLYLPEHDATIRYYDIAGDGQDVYVWLPGLSTSCSSLMHAATHPRIAGHRSILVDYLGTGYSDKPLDFDHSMQSHSECVASILRHESISRCTLIGHSMGGTVALHLALSHPQLVTRLIMSESNVEPGGGTGTRAIASFSEEAFVREEFPRMMAAFHRGSAAGVPNDQFHSGYYAVADPRGVHRQSVSLVNVDPGIKEQWFRMSIPRTFIIGEATNPHKTGERLPDTPYPEELLPHGISVFVVPRSGHFFMIDNLEGYVEALDKGLKTPTSAGRSFCRTFAKNLRAPKFRPLGLAAPLVLGGLVAFKLGEMYGRGWRMRPASE